VALAGLPVSLDAFTLARETPVFPAGAAGSWDAGLVDPGAIVYHDGLYHMLYNGVRLWPSAVDVGYATSSDGETWSRVGAAPVLTTAEVSFARFTIRANSLLVIDGQWVLYFTASSRSGELVGVIGRATAPGPEGPWTVDPEPVLPAGSPGAWDARAVGHAKVVQTADEFVMYYTGSDAPNRGQIGMATSADGRQWVKHNDPTTTAAPLAESDPVVVPGAGTAWDSRLVENPRVLPYGEGWVMVYRGERAGKAGFGFATSADGVRWTKQDANPVLTSDVLPTGRVFFYQEVLVRDDTLLLYIEAGSSNTVIYLATAKLEGR